MTLFASIFRSHGEGSSKTGYFFIILKYDESGYYREHLLIL